MKLYINYHTGAGNEWIEGILDDAKALADEGAAYTQQPISIHDEEGNELARRNWWGVEYDENEVEQEAPICFGDFGFFSDWQ